MHANDMNQWNPDFSNLKGNKIGVKLQCLTKEREISICSRYIGRFEKSKV